MKDVNAHHEISILPTWHLMVKDTGVRCPNIGLEATVQYANLGPVRIERLNIVITDPRSHICLFQSHTHGAHGGLRGQPRHA